MDFRGRAYPIPPHLSHLCTSFLCVHVCLLFAFYVAGDMCRAMLKFGIGYRLGENGLRWLKIHLSTLHGGTAK